MSDQEKQCPASWHGAKMDFSADMSYGDYLKLDQVLTAQHPLSPNHNEMLFIIQHQTSELWLKLMLHEMRAVRVQMRAGDLSPAFKMLARVARIMDQLVHAWDVLATMTPSEYTAVRPYLAEFLSDHRVIEIPMLVWKVILHGIILRTRLNPPWAEIQVEDNGIGMSENVRKRTFEPFFTTKEIGQGTGLGLSVSYFIITNNHKGQMEVHSTPGQGTCFTLRLPLTGSQLSPAELTQLEH